jgi:curli biogenesis system outer membrane secretion channel CsgG
MLKRISFLLYSLAIFSLSGCGLARLQSFPGDTRADIKLKMDTAQAVLSLASLGCTESLSLNNIVNTKVISADPSGHAWKEIWSVRACGKVTDYDVSFQSDGAGGTYFGVERKKN